jgi:hypothetical protein
VVNVWAETNERGESILFSFDYPGACGWGPSWTDAVNRLSRDLRITHTWMVSHGLYCPPPVDAFHVVEIVPATGKPLECDSEGFFNWDKDAFMFLHEFVPLLRCMSDPERQQVFEHRGERWTAKKVLRRAVWHELLHLKQLHRLVPKVVSAVS